ncbi:MAG: lipoprotein-releasing ABC transporter permease subunit [Deltaproteobacteria bacterium]|nr:lipoprotein-releasing ABC transporter permease subunit [Deltaproteobacteria bacterium]
MRFETIIALRHLRSKKRSAFLSIITIIAVMGIIIGVATMCVVLSVMSGFENDLKSRILGANAHLIVIKFGQNFSEYNSIISKLKEIKGIKGAAPFVLSEGMISSDTNLSGVIIKGIIPEEATKVMDIGKNIEAGSLENLNNPEKIPLRSGNVIFSGKDNLPGIIIGRELIKILHLNIGDVVTLFSPLGELSPFGPMPKSRKFKIVGIFYSGMYEFDQKFVYLHLKEAQKFFGLMENVTGVEITINDIDKTLEMGEAIKNKIGGYPYKVRNWMEMNRNLFSAIRLEKIVMFIILAFIILVASFNIISTLIMVVIERAKEIAILKTIGVKNRSVIRIFITEGLIIGIFGTVFGEITGYLLCKLLSAYHFQLDPEVYYITTLPVLINPLEFLAVAIAAIIISFLATIYPAYQAAKLRPTEGLRYE